MASKVYTFDEATHTHRIGGVIVPGITTVLKPLQDFSTIPPHILEAKRQWGSAVHKSVELYCLDCLDLETLDTALVGPLHGFQNWLKQQKFNPSDFIVETPMGDASLMVACIPDLILDGQAIIEIKTRKAHMLTDSIQTVCQERTWKKNGGIRAKEYERRVLSLYEDGTFDYVKVNHKDASSRFRLLVDHYWNTQKINSWRINP